MSKHSPFAALSGFLAVALVAVIGLAVAGVFDSGDGGSGSSAASSTPLTSTGTQAPAAPLPRNASVADIYSKVSPGVVQVESRTGGSNPLTGGGGGGTGSGFVIDDQGRVVTNDHVVDGATSVTVRFGEKEDPIPAKVLGADPSSDVALLKIDPGKVKGGIKPVTLGDSSKLRVGEPTVAIGSPFGLDGSLTTGVVSALDRTVKSPNGFGIDGVIQTDAAINPGNSGGPLLDGQGRVIGVNAQIATNGADSNSGVGFAIPVNTVKQVVPSLERSGSIKRAFLGVSTADVTPDVAKQLGLTVQNGALVGSVVNGGPADKAGIRAAGPDGRGGDVIVAVNGKAITQPDDVATAISSLKPGDQARVEVLRGSKRTTLTVTLGDRPKQTQTQQQP
jgi:S1-C subfamily serine protease